jgi:hypothetical protein
MLVRGLGLVGVIRARPLLSLGRGHRFGVGQGRRRRYRRLSLHTTKVSTVGSLWSRARKCSWVLRALMVGMADKRNPKYGCRKWKMEFAKADKDWMKREREARFVKIIVSRWMRKPAVRDDVGAHVWIHWLQRLEGKMMNKENTVHDTCWDQRCDVAAERLKSRYR